MKFAMALELLHSVIHSASILGLAVTTLQTLREVLLFRLPVTLPHQVAPAPSSFRGRHLLRSYQLRTQPGHFVRNPGSSDLCHLPRVPRAAKILLLGFVSLLFRAWPGPNGSAGEVLATLFLPYLFSIEWRKYSPQSCTQESIRGLSR